MPNAFRKKQRKHALQTNPSGKNVLPSHFSAKAGLYDSTTISVVVVVPSRAMVAVQWKCSGKPSGSPSVRVNHANRNDIVSLAFPTWFLGREHALKDRPDRMWCEILNDAAFYICIRCRGHVRGVDTVVMERFHVRGWGWALLHARRVARTRFAKSTSSAPPYPARQSSPA